MKNIHLLPTENSSRLFFKSLPISDKLGEPFILVENVRLNNFLLFINKPIRYISINTLSNNTVGMWKVYYKTEIPNRLK